MILNDNINKLMTTVRPEARILFVTVLSAGTEDDVHSRFGSDIRVVDFEELTAGTLDAFKPDFIVSTILTPRFDILDMAQKLDDLKFSGAYRVLIETPLPNPGVVLREVRSQHPKLDVDFVNLDMLRR